MLDIVKMALRIKTTAYDDLIEMLIEAAYQDLELAGVESADTYLYQDAVICYVAFNFPAEKDASTDKFKTAYDEKKAQLATATGYTDWLEDEEDE